MITDIAKLIRTEALSESCMNNSINDIESESRLDNIIDSLNYTYFKVPFTADAVHLIHHEGKFIVPYEDMKKFCIVSGTSTFTEAVGILADKYNLSPKNIYIGIQEDSSVNDMSITADRLESAINSGIIVESTEMWEDPDEFSDDKNIDYDFGDIDLVDMYGESINLIDDDNLKLAKLNESTKLDSTKFIKTMPKSAFKYEASMVNMYEDELSYYIEMDDLEKYMNYTGITSVKEAIMNIAEENDLAEKYDSIKILVERCGGKSRKKKSKKRKQASEKLEAMNLISKSNLDKLNLLWISKY